MDFITDHLITLILFSPAAVAAVMLFLPSTEKSLLRWTAFTASARIVALDVSPWLIVTMILLIYLVLGCVLESLAMVLLTTILTPLAILASYSITDKVKSYMILFLLLVFSL